MFINKPDKGIHERRKQTMTKAKLVEEIADKAMITKKDANAALKAFTDVVTEELAKGGKIQLVGFGTFETSKRAERNGRNPITGEATLIPSSTAVKFRVGAALKKAVN